MATGEVDVTLCYSEVRHPLIERHTAGQVAVVACALASQAAAEMPPLAEKGCRSRATHFNHVPDTEAMEWSRRPVLRRLKATGVGLALGVYGEVLSAALCDPAAPDLLIEGCGEDVRSTYDRHRIFVASLHSEAGIHGKVLKAMTSGIPSVLLPVTPGGSACVIG